MHAIDEISPVASGVASRARRRIAARLSPLVFSSSTSVNYIDRVNVSFANLRMSAELAFSDKVYGLGVGDVLRARTCCSEIPGAIIVERWSARKWIARIMISWGIVTLLTGFIHSPASSTWRAMYWESPSPVSSPA